MRVGEPHYDTGERPAIRFINTEAEAVCSYCGAVVPIRRGRLWRCWSEYTGKCAAPEHRTADGWHCSCLDTKACKKRVEEQVRARSRISLEVGVIASLVRRDWALPPQERTRTAELVLQCRLTRVERFYAELEGGEAQVELLTQEPRFEAVQSAVACCLACSWEEYQQVELVLSSAERRAA